MEAARKQYDALTQPAGSTAATQPAAPAKTVTPAKTAAAPAAAPARARSSQKSGNREIELFGGYSFYRDSSDAINFPVGFGVSVARNFRPSIDLLGQMTINHKGSDIPGADASANLYSFLAGPRYTMPTSGGVAFAQVLGGLGVSQGSAFGISDSSAGFALQPGIGFDYPLTPLLAFRAGWDVEMIHDTRWFTGFRLSFGLKMNVNVR